MRTQALNRLMMFLSFVVFMTSSGCVWAMDEAVLTPTSKAVIVQEDKEFNNAMSIWFKHRYADGEKMLREFSSKHPDSRWTAESDLHIGCYLTYLNRLDDARAIFNKVIDAHPKNIAATKAKIRLGNVAERGGRFDEAIDYYCNALKMNPSWDQFKYANYRARKLIMTAGKRQARINCGPVALAACLDALGKPSEAASVREIKADVDGISLAQLKAEVDKRRVPAHTVIMQLDDLKTADLPVLAHVQPNHFVAVIGVDKDKVRLQDSIQGKYETTWDSLAKTWSGIVVSFAQSIEDQPIAVAMAAESRGGCCGQADDDECLGDSDCECQQGFSGGGGGGGGPCGSGGPCFKASSGPPSGGSPTWVINTVNLNLLVKDTPIWYNPGKGPHVAFTLTYSNENSNTGIFGCGWRSPYDMKVFFLPSGDPYHPSLQLHRANGRIETYEWESDQYLGRSSMRSYGYQDTIQKLTDGTVVLSLKNGGKYYFMPEGGIAEGRIRYIEDEVGNRVTCEYDSQTGNLTTVKDANNRVTEVETTGSGITERVTKVTIPDSRFALFGYTDGCLTSITDMGTLEKPGYTSTLTYGALAWGGEHTTYLTQDVTASPLSPANGGSLGVTQYGDPFWSGTDGFPPSGTIKVTNTNDPPQEEVITYTGKTTDRFLGITRSNTPIDAVIGDIVQSEGSSEVPYLSTIETPSRKTKFTYEWWTFDYAPRPVVALHEVFECAAGEDYPTVPTIHYAWCSATYAEYTTETRYPTAVTPGGSGCSTHWTGGLTKKYKVYPSTEDAIGSIMDVINGVDQPPTVLYEEYDWNRNRTKVKDGNGNRTEYTYDGDHNRTSRKDPLGNTWSYEYINNRVETEKDPDSNKVKIYTYNSAGQITKVETELTPGVRSTLVQNFYYPGGSDAHKIVGQLDYVVDGRGKTTSYYYNEDGETRGFLTSIEDPEGHRVRYHYDEEGRRDQVIDASSNVTTYEFDNLDRTVKVTNPDNTTVETQYSCCHKEQVKDENGKTTKYDYDGRNRLWAMINAAVDTTLAQSISAGDTQIPLTSVAGFPNNGSVLLKSPNGETEIATYGGINGSTLTTVVRGQFGTTAKAFAAANVTEGSITVNVYDEDVKDINGNYIHRGILDRKIGLYDASGHLTQYEFYENNKLKKTSYPDATWEQYTYDNAGNMTKKECGHASVVTKTVNYVYDVNNKLVSSSGQ